MNVAILTDGIYPFVIGGMQKHSYYLVKFLVQKGINVTLYHCVPFGDAIITNAELKKELNLENSANIESVCFNFPQSGFLPGHYIKESYAYSHQIYNQIEKDISTFDIIYAKGFSGWKILEEKTKGKVKFPPICTKFHGYEMFQIPASFKEKLKQYFLRGPVSYNNLNADYVFSYGGKISDIIKKIGLRNDKIIDIPTGIENKWISKKTLVGHDLRKFLFVGRYERRKGIEELNKALSQIIHQFEFEFHFVGPIPKEKQIKSDKVIYHGKIMDVTKMQEIVDSCEVLVCPSYSEGMPNVIMESMARGLAIIATDVGAINQVVSTKNGWLIDAANQLELLNSLKDAIDLSPKNLINKRNNSLQIIKDFTWENVSDLTIKSFNQILNKV